MEKEQVVETIRSIFAESGIRDLEAYATTFEGRSDDAGMFYVKPSARGEVLWARDIYEEGAAFPAMPVLSLAVLAEITSTISEADGGVELEILFELGSWGMPTHQIQYQYTAFEEDDCDSSASLAIFSHDTQRRSLAGEAANLMAALALGPHDQNIQMSIESQFERCLFAVDPGQSEESLGMFEKRLRKDIGKGIPRSAMQYVMLSLHGSDEVRAHFDREFALSEALAINGVPGMLRDCLNDHYFRVVDHQVLSKALSDIDNLVIARSMGGDWPAEPIMQMSEAMLRERWPLPPNFLDIEQALCPPQQPDVNPS